MAALLSTHDVAMLLGTEEWRVRRLFQDGSLPEPTRFAGKRAISSDAVPAIADVLRARGWLPNAAGLAQ